jgi:NAD(P)-dependent dehydrogenase (short-subunit alcohol dehydrogenase family)
MSKLDGKTALITGGSSGIGLAVARVFLQEGAKVAITGRDEAKLRQAVASLAGGERLFSHAADVADPAQVQTLVKQVVERLGGLDILVNNAGLNLKERSLRELTPESWQRLLRANLDGAFYCIHAALPHLLQRGGGLVININSIAGKRASPLGGAAYSASKFGMRGLGLCLSAEEKGNGIRVSNIYPGEVNTPILDVRPRPVTAEQRQRILQPDDVAAAVLFVATLPPYATVPELVITPVQQGYV